MPVEKEPKTSTVILWCNTCQAKETTELQISCSQCGKYAYTHIKPNPMYPLPEDVFNALRSLIRSDTISENEMEAIKKLCERGLGENMEPYPPYDEEEIPFHTRIPQNIRLKHSHDF